MSPARPLRSLLAAAAAVALATGCTGGGGGSAAPTAQARGVAASETAAPTLAPSSQVPPSTPAPAATTPAPGGHESVLAGGVVLPDRSRTPGATNPAVTQATIASTICRSGYTSTIRPPSAYTTALKRAQLAAGYTYRGDTATRDYEEDHLVSLELGGAPRDPRNLWPEPYVATEGARVKDRIENKLHELVCAGSLTLRAAQRAIATNWWHAYQLYIGRTAAPAPRPAPSRAPAVPHPTRTPPQPASAGGTDEGVVHPGAFCAPEGATGHTTRGTPMVCGPASDGRDRWHRG